MIATAMRAIIDAAARNSALAEEGANPGVLADASQNWAFGRNLPARAAGTMTRRIVGDAFCVGSDFNTHRVEAALGRGGRPCRRNSRRDTPRMAYRS
jgi:hypothetical protein